MSRTDPSPEVLAALKARNSNGLIWHVGSFLIVNAFLWAIDLMTGSGFNWAYWVTSLWSFGLAFHVLAFIVDERQVEERPTQPYVEDARSHQTLIH